jgi:hypothetical protein
VVRLHTHVLQHREDTTRGADSLRLSCADTGHGYTVIDNRDKDILAGRKVGFLECDAEFVSFVDDDDETLLTRQHVDSILAASAPALFTDSIVTGGIATQRQVAPAFTQWSLHAEKRGYIRPHQTIVYRREVAAGLLAQGEALIAKHGWDKNSIDHVMRLLASVSFGWVYLPAVTYKWHRHAGGEHMKRPTQNNAIRKFFMG